MPAGPSFSDAVDDTDDLILWSAAGAVMLFNVVGI